MRITERQLRSIVREEAHRLLREGPGDRLSILPADVPPELFIGWMRRAYRKLPQPTGDLRKRFLSVAERAGLEPRIAEELAGFAIACLEPGESFPFDIETAGDRIVEALGYDPRRAGKAIMQMRVGLAERVLGDQFNGPRSGGFGIAASVRVLYDLTHEFPRILPNDLAALGRVDRGELERGIDTMDALYVFAEPKELPATTRRKLMGMVGMGVEGALQAAEIYGMM